MDGKQATLAELNRDCRDPTTGSPSALHERGEVQCGLEGCARIKTRGGGERHIRHTLQG